MRRFAIAVFLLSIAIPVQARQHDSWIGQTVLLKRARVSYVFTDPKTGKEVSLGMLTGVDYKVEAEQGDWVQVRQNGVAGWVNKNNVVRLGEAVDYFTRRIRARPNSADYNHRAVAWQLQGQLDKAIADFDEAIGVDPNDPAAFNNRGSAWEAKRNYDKAIADFSEAIDLDPNDAVAFRNRGRAWGAKKEFDKAIADFTELIRLDPKDAFAFINRAVAWGIKKEYEKAMADFTEAARLEPKNVIALNARARLWSTCPVERYRDGKRAVESATKACELTGWKEPETIDTLAAAYAEAGQFEDAVKYQERTLTFPGFEKAQGKAARERLKLYREKKAYREE